MFNMKKSFIIAYAWSVISFVIICVFFILWVFKHESEPSIVQCKAPEKPQRYKLTVSNVWHEIKDQGIYFDSIVLAQSVLETGWYTSYNCRVRNNLFGYKGGKKDSTNTHGYAVYDTWQGSVRAYKWYQLKRLNYYRLLEAWGYHQSTDYEWKCESIKQTIFYENK